MKFIKEGDNWKSTNGFYIGDAETLQHLVDTGNLTFEQAYDYIMQNVNNALEDAQEEFK